MISPELRGWRRLVFGPRSAWTALIAAALLTLPFCATGVFMDDYLHLVLLDGVTTAAGNRWDLFTFADGNPAHTMPMIEHGPFPWWTLPELQFSFLRPLTAVFANLDHALFQGNIPLAHFQSVLWYLGLVAVVDRLLRRAFGPGSRIAALGLLLFAIDDAHAVIVGWIANRNALIATVPALLGVIAHVRWRQDGWGPGLPLSVLGAALGLAGGEPALGALAYLGAWEILEGGGRRLPRWKALIPMALLGVAYVVTYKLTGSGAWGSEIYTDPLREPAEYLRQAPAKAMALVGAQFLGATADLWLVMRAARPVLVLTGVVALGGVGALMRALWGELPEGERRALRWLTLGAGLSVLPVLATFPLNRLLLMPSIGASALVAALILQGWSSARGRWVRGGARLLVGTHLVFGLLAWPMNLGIFSLGAALQAQAALETSLSDEALSGRVVVFLAPDPAAAIYLPLVRRCHGRSEARVWLTLSFALYPHRLSRVDARTVDVDVVGGRMLESVFEQLVRSSAFPIPVGTRVSLDGLDVEVTRLDQGLPSGLRVHFHEAPDGGSYTLARWDGDHLGPLVLPAVGESLLLPKPNGFLSR